MPNTRRKSEPAPLQLPARTMGPIGLRPHAEQHVEAPGRSHRTERRNLASRDALLRRVALEYAEMPGVSLTLAQAKRLFGLREDVCIRVLNALAEAGILRRDARGAFVRNVSRP